MKPITHHVNRLRAALGGAIREPKRAFISPNEDGTGVAYADTGDQYAIYVVLEETREQVIAYYSPEIDLGLLTGNTAVRILMNDRGQYDIIGADRATLRDQYRGSAFTRGFNAIRLTLATITTAIITALRFATATELTIATGAITRTQVWHTVDTESDAASDDLDTIGGGVDGDLLIIRPANAARTVVVTQAGNIVTGTGASISLDDTSKSLWLIYDEALTKWVVVGGFGTGGATAALDNLAAVAINTSLVSDTDNTDDLGSSSTHWRHTYTNAVTMTEGSAPSTPATNKWALYFKTDGAYVKDDAGAETGPLGASSGSTPSIVSNTRTAVRLHNETLASAGRFDVSSISGSYEDLFLRLRLRGTVSSTSDNCYLFFNNDTTTSNYHYQRSVGFNGAASPLEGTIPLLATIAAGTSPTGAFNYIEVRIPDYASTSFRKIAFITYGVENNTTDLQVGTGLVRWDSTSAITQITIQPDGYATHNLDTGSTLRMYGVSDVDQVTNVT